MTDLLGTGTVRRAVDSEALTAFLADSSAWGELYRDIGALPPGGEVAIDDGVFRRAQRYPEPEREEWFDEPIEELVERLRARLLEAAEWAARDVRSIAVLVGGVDSSGVLGALARVVPLDRVHVMTIHGGDGELDPDLPYVEELCRHLGVRMHRFEWSPKTSPIEDGLIVDGRPAYAPYFTQAWVRQLAELGVERLVFASGGDAVFGGTMQELAHRVTRAPIRAMRTALARVPWGASTRERAHWVLAEHLEPLRRRRRQAFPSFLGPRLRQRAARPARRPVVARKPSDRMRDWYGSPHMVTGLLVQQALTSGLPMTFRDATLHPPLVQFLASVPIEVLNCDGRYRGLYHRAIAPWVSPSVRKRKTKSFHDPLLQLLPQTERVLRDLARGTMLEREGYVVGRELSAAFEIPEKRQAIWQFLTAEAWLRRCT